MKRLLAIAIALFTLGVLPVAAETTQQSILIEEKPSIWLILVIGNGYDDGDLLSLPMKSIDQCEEQGAIWMTSTRAIRSKDPRGFECLEGK